MDRRTLLASTAATAAAAVVGVPTAAGAARRSRASVLVFSRTAGFRHSSIPLANAAIGGLGAAHGLTVDATESPAAFTDEQLATYDAVIFCSTTGDVLGPDEQAAFERYVRGGGGYVGVHAASDTEYDWPFYGELVGAYFAGHPAPQDAVVVVEDDRHPATRRLPQRWARFDEWYAFDRNPRQDVRVLASLDESSYDPGDGAMGDHPIAWEHRIDLGRAFYTALGHTEDSWREPLFLEHVLGGIRSVTREARGR